MMGKSHNSILLSASKRGDGHPGDEYVTHDHSQQTTSRKEKANRQHISQAAPDF